MRVFKNCSEDHLSVFATSASRGNSPSKTGTILEDEQAEVSLRGCAWAFDRLEKKQVHSFSTKNLRTLSQRFLARCRCPLCESSLWPTCSIQWEILTNEWDLSLFTDSILISTPCFPSHSTRAFCRHTRRRFESTHVHTQDTNNRETDRHRQTYLFLSTSLFTCLSLSSHNVSLSLVVFVFCLFSMMMIMSTRPIGSLSLWTHGPDSLSAKLRVRGSWSIPRRTNMFASCTKQLS